MPPELPVPPPELAAFVGGSFVDQGEHFFDLFTRQAGLQPHHRFLDVGCGIGRIAVPLTRYLRPPGCYEGFDIVDVGIEWCQQHITPIYPSFRFQLVDVFSRGYNPTGRYLARDYRFPFPDASFDFVCATSLFTHLVPADLENYLAESTRVLAPGGRLLATFFIQNEEAQQLAVQTSSAVRFLPQRGYWTNNPRVPEEAVAYSEPYLRGLCEAFGLQIEGGFRYGSWCGRKNALSGQDVLIATRSSGTVRRRRSSWWGRPLHLMRRLLSGPLQNYWQSAIKSSIAVARRQVAQEQQALANR